MIESIKTIKTVQRPAIIGDWAQITARLSKILQSLQTKNNENKIKYDN